MQKSDATSIWKPRVVICAALTVKSGRAHAPSHLCKGIMGPVQLQLHFTQSQLKVLQDSSTEGTRKDS